MRAPRAAGWPEANGPGDPSALPSQAAVSLALSSSADLATLLEVTDAAARATLGGAETRFFLVDERSGAVRPWDAGRGGPGDAYLPPAGGVLDWVLRREEPVFAPAARAGGPCLEKDLWGVRRGGFLGLPLVAGGALLGAWVVAFPTAHVFSHDERLFAYGIGDALAVALERRARERTLAEADERIGRLEARAEEGEALLAQMLSVVAHEMRTPLTCIKAYAETLIDAPADQWAARVPFLGIIDEECDRLGRLLTNALDYSRLESGQRSFHLATLLPADLLQDLVLTLAPESKRRGVDLVVRVPEGFGPIEGDPDLLKQLCLNLAGNAVKFSPEGASVDLVVSGDAERWLLEVIDRGPGIPEDQRERIFERFYRVEQDGRQPVPGTGLGLAIARGIAELHGGRIWASAAPAGGSVFSADLPRVQRACEEARALARSIWERPGALRLLAEGVRIISEVMEAQIVSAMLVDPERGDLRFVSALGLDDSVLRRRVAFRGGIAGKALAQAAPVLVGDIENDPRFRRPNHPQYNTKSLVCVPLVVDGQAVGVVNVNNKRSRQAFDEHDLAVLSSIVARLAAAVRRARSLVGVAEALEEETAALRASIVPRRDLVLGGRSAGVLAGELARRLGAADEDARRLGALAEGAGTAGAAEESADADRARCGKSARRAKGVKGAVRSRVADLGGARDILLGRHEWWDGSGRPHGAAGESIVLGARILAAVDGLGALTQGSRYRPAVPGGQALVELEHGSGRRFDPQVVAAIVDLVAEDAGLDATAAAGGGAPVVERRRGQVRTGGRQIGGGRG